MPENQLWLVVRQTAGTGGPNASPDRGKWLRTLADYFTSNIFKDNYENPG